MNQYDGSNPDLFRQYIFNRKTFKATEDGLISNSHLFDIHADKQLPRLDAWGAILEHEPQPENLPAAYWKAQCAFRGLETNGDMRTLQDRIRTAFREGRHDMIAVLVLIEEKLQGHKRKQREQEKKSAEEEERKWKTSSDELKAEIDLGRFLKEKFPLVYCIGTAKLAFNNVVVLKSVSESQLRHYADRLVLKFESTNLLSKDLSGQMESWSVIGRSSKAISERILEINRQSKLSRQPKRQLQCDDISQEPESKKRRSMAVENSRPPESVSDQVHTEVPKLAWPVSGTWIINCPAIEKKWHDNINSTCSLKIRMTQGQAGHWQMWAAFNFIIIKGIFRFVTPARSIPLGASDGGSYDEDGDDGGENEPSHGDTEDGSSNEDRTNGGSNDEVNSNHFLISTAIAPSAAHRIWPYYWRGEETDKNEVFGPEDIRCHLIFSNDGTGLKGTFGSSLTGKVSITGMKMRNFEEFSSSGAVENTWKRRGGLINGAMEGRVKK